MSEQANLPIRPPINDPFPFENEILRVNKVLEKAVVV
jgi:hypothetical protein